MTKTDQFGMDVAGEMNLLKRYAIKLCRDSDLAEDLVQEAITRALVHRQSFTPGSNMRGWLMTILRNQYFEVCRRAHRCVEDPADLLSTRIPAADDQLGALIAKDAISHIAMLSEPQRLALFLSSQGASIDEIAAREGVPNGTIKSRISRARSGLADLLGDRELLNA